VGLKPLVLFLMPCGFIPTDLTLALPRCLSTLVLRSILMILFHAHAHHTIHSSCSCSHTFPPLPSTSHNPPKHSTLRHVSLAFPTPRGSFYKKSPPYSNSTKTLAPQISSNFFKCLDGSIFLRRYLRKFYVIRLDRIRVR